jgi:predicted S18 family serine protease
MRKQIKNNNKKINQKNNKSNIIFYIISFNLGLLLVLNLVIYLNLKNNFSNQVSLLAILENDKKEIVGSNIIKLKLNKVKGVGNILFESSSLINIDTQISILNSHKITCEIFNLECNSNDFIYSFENKFTLLKGPSAGSSISYLLYKTIKEEETDKKIAFTGTLNSGGVVGVIGGVDKKIELAQKNNFTKIFIPFGNKINKSKNITIKVEKILDIEKFNEKFEYESYVLDKKDYEENMKKLSLNLCNYEKNLTKLINFKNKKNFSKFVKSYFSNYNLSLENSKLSKNIDDYSKGSFCFVRNLNLRNIYEFQNYKKENFTLKYKKLKNEIDKFILKISNKKYIKNEIKTLNDFYVYLLLIDRSFSALNYLEDFETNKNLTKEDKISMYSFSYERLNTVYLWEKLIQNKGKILNENLIEKIDLSCNKIKNKIELQNIFLEELEIKYFDNVINNFLSKIDNSYLCLYKGLELNSRINTILNYHNLEENQTKKLFQNYNLIAKKLIYKLSKKDSFPIIPYIYLKYSQDLINSNQTQGALNYINQAIEFSQINSYLD